MSDPMNDTDLGIGCGPRKPGPRTVRISMDLFYRLGSVPGVGKTEMVRRALRCFWRDFPRVVPAPIPRNTTGGSTVLRLVDLDGLDRGLSGEGVRRIIEQYVPSMDPPQFGDDVAKDEAHIAACLAGLRRHGREVAYVRRVDGMFDIDA